MRTLQIFATFEYSSFVELAVSELETKGVKDIYAVPLEANLDEPRLMDTLHRADGVSFVDKAFIFAFLFSTIGASKGFVWTWGPVIWGLLGAGFGLLFGFLLSGLLYLLRRRKKRARSRREPSGDVILIVTCEEAQAELVQGILRSHFAIGMAVTR